MVRSIETTHQIIINPKVHSIVRNNRMEIPPKIKTKKTYLRN